ncbi:hypothetical protein KAU11_09000 [Candidatus Babeliales bacterium]|nr:hypothetical protein [Candidatus Babeliales bacterium]
MPNFTIIKKDGSKGCIERKDFKTAEKFAKGIGAKITHVGVDVPAKKEVKPAKEVETKEEESKEEE